MLLHTAVVGKLRSQSEKIHIFPYNQAYRNVCIVYNKENVQYTYFDLDSFCSSAAAAATAAAAAVWIWIMTKTLTSYSHFHSICTYYIRNAYMRTFLVYLYYYIDLGILYACTYTQRDGYHHHKARKIKKIYNKNIISLYDVFVTLALCTVCSVY